MKRCVFYHQLPKASLPRAPWGSSCAPVESKVGAAHLVASLIWQRKMSNVTLKTSQKKASLRDTSWCKQGNGTFVEMIMIEFKTRPAGVSHWSIVLHCRILLHPNERLHLFGSVIQDSAKVNLVRILSYKHSNPTNGFRMGQGIPRVPVILSNCIIYSKQPLYNNLNFIRFSRM